MINRRFGRLVVQRQAKGRRDGRLLWSCACDCGREAVATTSGLRGGDVRSCGCLRVETFMRVRRPAPPTTHGMTHHPMRYVWKDIVSRCRHPSNHNYSRYGGRGIRVCSFIAASPANIESLIGSRPAAQSVDRADNDANYSCGRCDECRANGWVLNIRWATRFQQARNTRKTVMVVVNDIRMCLKDAAAVHGVNYGTVINRRLKGWPVTRLFDPPRQPKYLRL